MNILVTGGSGEIGSALIRELVRKNHKVFSCDIVRRADEYTETTSMMTTDWSYIRADISEYRELDRVFSLIQPDIVFNCAAKCGRWDAEDHYESLWQTNVIGLKHLLEFQNKLRFGLVHFSTSEIYGNVERVLTEDVPDKIPVKPLGEYALTKYVNEIQIRNATTRYGTKSVIVRPFCIYGIGEIFSPYRSFISKFIYSCIKGIPFTVYKNHGRTITYLDDAVACIANIADNFKSGEVYNIAADNFLGILEIAEKIVKLSESRMDLMQTVETNEILTVLNKRADNTKSKRDLQYKDSVSVDEGLGRTIEWARIALT